MVGLTGLASDVLTLDHTLKMHCNLYKLRENREIKPETFSALLSTLLYEKRSVKNFGRQFQLHCIAVRMKFYLCWIELLASSRSTHTVQHSARIPLSSLLISSHLNRIPPSPSHCMNTPHIPLRHPHTTDTRLIQPFRHYPSLYCAVLN
jgi:hypothetical protein